MKKTDTKKKSNLLSKLLVSMALVGIAAGAPIAASADNNPPNNVVQVQATKGPSNPPYGAARVGWGGCGGCGQ